MDYGTVPGIDKPVSRVAQGGDMLRTDQQAQSFELLDAVFAQGCTAFDNAHVYGGGGSERVLGRWINDRGIRGRVVILTKGAHHNPDRRRVTPFDIAADLYDSLARLGTDHIDLYVLHRDDPSVPVGPIVECLNEHRDAGRIGAFGGSNWTHRRIAEANEYADQHGLVGFAVSSPNFSLAEMVREPWGECVSIGGPAGAEARAWYADNQLAIFSWSTLARGFFSGRFTRQDMEARPADDRDLAVYSFRSEDNLKRLDRVHELAAAKGCTVPQLALAWVLNQPLNVFALVGAASGEEYRANAVACDLKLTPAELAWLDLQRDTPA